MSNWRDLETLIAADRRAREAQWYATHRPWLDDSQPDGSDPEPTRPNLLFSATVLFALELIVIAALYVGCVRLSAWALDTEAAIERAHTAAMVQQMEGQ